MNYSLKEPEAVKNELIIKAVKDSKKKALCLTEALGVSLGEVRDIDYSWHIWRSYQEDTVRLNVNQ